MSLRPYPNSSFTPWSDSRTTIHDHHKLWFPKSALPTHSNGVNHTLDAHKSVMPRGPTNLFSHFLSSSSRTTHPSVELPPSAMKHKLLTKSHPKSSPPIMPPRSARSLISPTLLNDPAFSPDPQAHPLHVTSSESGWTSAPAAGHPRLKNDTGRPPPYPSTPPRDPYEFQLIQPPNTPLSPDAPNSSDSAFPFSSPSDSDSSTSVSSSTTPPSSANSHLQTPVAMSHTAPDSPTAPPEKRKRTISLFRRKPPPAYDPIILEPPAPEPAPEPAPKSAPEPAPEPAPETMTSQSKPILNKIAPVQAIETPNRPPAVRHVTFPEIPQAPERPSLPPRPATTPADTRPPTSARRTGPGRRVRAHELDRIDELDETNPLGHHVHHGGPYEAIQKLAREAQLAAHNVGIQYQYQHDPSHVPQKDKSHKPSRRATPADSPLTGGMSLNLAPGQILPRHVMPSYESQFLSNHPYHQHPQTFNNDNPNLATHGNTNRHQPQYNPSIPPHAQPNPPRQSQQWQSQPSHFDPYTLYSQPTLNNAPQQQRHQHRQRHQSLPMTNSTRNADQQPSPPVHDQWDLRTDSAPYERDQWADRVHVRSNQIPQGRGSYTPFVEPRHIEQQRAVEPYQRDTFQGQGSQIRGMDAPYLESPHFEYQQQQRADPRGVQPGLVYQDQSPQKAGLGYASYPEDPSLEPPEQQRAVESMPLTRGLQNNGIYTPVPGSHRPQKIEQQQRAVHNRRDMQQQVSQSESHIAGAHIPPPDPGQRSTIVSQQRPVDPDAGNRQQTSQGSQNSRMHSPSTTPVSINLEQQRSPNLEGERDNQNRQVAEGVQHQAPQLTSQRPAQYTLYPDIVNDTQQQQRRAPDAQSVQQSVSGSSYSSGSSRSRPGPPQPHYRPKRLVMPAPLQQGSALKQNQPQRQPQPHQFQPQPRGAHAQPEVRLQLQPQPLYPPPQLQETSQPQLMPISDPYSSPSLLPPRAQDIPMVPDGASRKLRKRSSVNPSIPSAKPFAAPPVAAVSFSADLGFVEPSVQPKSEKKSKVKEREKERQKEKAPKRVLSKRRNDL